MKHITALIGILFVLFTATACMTFREGLVEDAGEGPIKSAAQSKKPTIALFIDAEYYHNGTKSQMIEQALEKYRGQILQIYQESGAFSKIDQVRYINDFDKRTAENDYGVRVILIVREDSPLLLAVLTGLTLYIIPSWAFVDYEVQTEVYNPGADKIQDINKKESTTLVQQLLFMFGMPFAFPITVADETIRDLNKASIEEAVQAGLF